MTQLETVAGTAYDVTGTNGPAIVLIHGLGLNRHSWQWQVPALAKNHRVITFDLFGHGDSAVPPATPSLSVFARQIVELLDELRLDKAAVAGFSLGGMIARRFAMDHPERLWALAVLHSAHARDAAAQAAIAARVAQVRAEGPGATVEAALQRWFTDQFRAANPATMDLVRGWIMANRKEVYAPIYQVLADGVTELVAPSPPIAIPALVMTGSEDYGNSAAMYGTTTCQQARMQLAVCTVLRSLPVA